MFMLNLVSNLIKRKRQKERLYELACECNSVFLNKKQASEIVEQMFECKNCEKPVYLVTGDEEII